MALWVNKAAQERKVRLVPGSAKWVAKEIQTVSLIKHREVTKLFSDLKTNIDQDELIQSKILSDPLSLLAELDKLTISHPAISPDTTFIKNASGAGPESLLGHNILLEHLPRKFTAPIGESTQIDIVLDPIDNKLNSALNKVDNAFLLLLKLSNIVDNEKARLSIPNAHDVSNARDSQKQINRSNKSDEKEVEFKDLGKFDVIKPTTNLEIVDRSLQVNPKTVINKDIMDRSIQTNDLTSLGKVSAETPISKMVEKTTTKTTQDSIVPPISYTTFSKVLPADQESAHALQFAKSAANLKPDPSVPYDPVPKQDFEIEKSKTIVEPQLTQKILLPSQIKISELSIKSRAHVNTQDELILEKARMKKIMADLRLQKIIIPKFDRKLKSPVRPSSILIVRSKIKDLDNSSNGVDKSNTSFEAIKYSIRKSIAEKRKSSRVNPVESNTVEVKTSKESESSVNANDIMVPKSSISSKSSPAISQKQTPLLKSNGYVSLPSKGPIPMPSAHSALAYRKKSLLAKSNQLMLTDKLKTASKFEEPELDALGHLSPVKPPSSIMRRHLPFLMDLPLLQHDSKVLKQESNIIEPILLKHNEASVKKSDSSTIPFTLNLPRPADVAGNRFPEVNKKPHKKSKNDSNFGSSTHDVFKPYSNNLSATTSRKRESPQRSSPLRKHQTSERGRGINQHTSKGSISKSPTQSRSPSRGRHKENGALTHPNLKTYLDFKVNSIEVNLKNGTNMEVSKPVEVSSFKIIPKLQSAAKLDKPKTIGTTSKYSTFTNSSPVKRYTVTGSNRPAVASPLKFETHDMQFGHSTNETTSKYKPQLAETAEAYTKILRLTQKDQNNSDAQIIREIDIASPSHADDEQLLEKDKRAKLKTIENNISSNLTHKSRFESKKVSTSIPGKSSRRINAGNSIPLPDAARGIFVGKRRPANQDHQKSNGVVKSSTRPPFSKTPLRLSKHVLPKTPIKSNDLPEIYTDDEDSDLPEAKKRKILKDWARTPELLRTAHLQQSVDPNTIFDPLNIRAVDVFESNASKVRIMQSPAISPINPDRQREEHQYAIRMGFK